MSVVEELRMEANGLGLYKIAGEVEKFSCLGERAAIRCCSEEKYMIPWLTWSIRKKN